MNCGKFAQSQTIELEKEQNTYEGTMDGAHRNNVGQKKQDTKNTPYRIPLIKNFKICKMNPSILTKSEKKLLPKGEGVMHLQGAQEIPWNFGNVPYLDLDGGYLNMRMDTK